MIEQNSSSQSGAGLYISGSTADAIVKDCIFRNNSAPLESDVMVIDGASLLLQGTVKLKE